MAFQFNQVTLDTDLYRLSRSGEPVSVEPQVFDLLVYLIEHRNRVVTRDELLQNLWPGKVVSDAALGARLKDVRKAVGDSGSKQHVIKTIHGRGYQFIAPVTDKAATVPTATEAAESRYSLPDQPSIAVLPFSNMSDDPQQEYFADGMTDEIITALSRVPGLFVIANNSIMTYKGRAVDVKQVGREQGVRYVLEGGIRKAGDQIRVTAQLIDATTGLHVWAERYQRRLDDIFAVQEEITHQVAVELQVKLVTGERSRAWAAGTGNVLAWEHAIRAKALCETHVRENAIGAREHALKALELDENYSTAWTTLGWSHWEEAVWDWSADPENSLRLAREAAEMAILQNDSYPGAYALLGYVFQAEGDYENAIEMCEKAVEVAPGDASVLALLGNVLVECGQIEAGIKKLRRALRMCPFPPAWYLSVLGSGYHLLGDNDTAVPLLRDAVACEPESLLGRLWLISALIETGDENEARELVRQALEISPETTAENWLGSWLGDDTIRERVHENFLAAGLPA